MIADGPLPGFFIIGAQKSGTSTLHRLLQLHPQAFLCDPKEPHYFADQAAVARGERWYRGLFAGAGDARAVGEASTTYSMYPFYSGVVERLTAVVPEPKLIYLLREPIARMRSAYLHALARGSETRPIAQALLDDPRYLLTSCYALQIEQWLTRVPSESVLLLSLDELRADPGTLLARTAAFLGLDAGWRPAELPFANPSEGKRPPRAWWRALGGLTLRTGTTGRVPGWMVRLNDSSSSWVHRAVASSELELPANVVAQLRRALHNDSRRLARLWKDSTPPWLDRQAI